MDLLLVSSNWHQPLATNMESRSCGSLLRQCQWLLRLRPCQNSRHTVASLRPWQSHHTDRLIHCCYLGWSAADVLDIHSRKVDRRGLGLQSREWRQGLRFWMSHLIPYHLLPPDSWTYCFSTCVSLARTRYQPSPQMLPIPEAEVCLQRRKR